MLNHINTYYHKRLCLNGTVVCVLQRQIGICLGTVGELLGNLFGNFSGTVGEGNSVELISAVYRHKQNYNLLGLHYLSVSSIKTLSDRQTDKTM